MVSKGSKQQKEKFVLKINHVSGFKDGCLQRCFGRDGRENHSVGKSSSWRTCMSIAARQLRQRMMQGMVAVASTLTAHTSCASKLKTPCNSAPLKTTTSPRVTHMQYI